MEVEQFDEIDHFWVCHYNYCLLQIMIYWVIIRMKYEYTYDSGAADILPIQWRLKYKLSTYYS